MYNAIYDQVIGFIHDSHHGFLTGRSCSTQPLLIHHDWFKVLDKRGQVDVVFIVIHRAVMVFKLLNNLAPVYLCSKFIPRNKLVNCPLRDP